jgi:hypothetical protein
VRWTAGGRAARVRRRSGGAIAGGEWMPVRNKPMQGPPCEPRGCDRRAPESDRDGPHGRPCDRLWSSRRRGTGSTHGHIPDVARGKGRATTGTSPPLWRCRARSGSGLWVGSLAYSPVETPIAPPCYRFHHRGTEERRRARGVGAAPQSINGVVGSRLLRFKVGHKHDEDEGAEAREARTAA